MIIGCCEVRKLATKFESKRPHSYFYEMGRERQDSDPRYKDYVRQEANPDTAKLQVAANYPDDRSKEECMNDDGAESDRQADEQRIQNRYLIRWSHLCVQRLRFDSRMR